jgi:hypothetical protein
MGERTDGACGLRAVIKSVEVLLTFDLSPINGRKD